MKKILVLLFVGASTLTVITNYLNYSTGIDPLLSSSDEDIVSTYMSKQFTLQWLQYRVNRTEIESNLSNSTLVKISNWPWANCTNVTSDTWLTGETLRKMYTIFKNIIKADREVSCNDPLITLTTHGDYRFLANLVPVAERWQGPISMSLYTPYDDLIPTLERIAFMRECTTPLIKKWVSFHLFSETRYFHYTSDETAQLWLDLKRTNRTKLCSTIPEFNDHASTSRSEHKLLYPVNIARNLARQMARTRYIFASDVELYPSIDFIPKFFKMLSRYKDYFKERILPYVFVVPIFEMEEGFDLPDTKEQLIDYVESNISVSFHKYVCLRCHIIPKYEQWLVGDGKVVMSNITKPEEGEMTVFHVAKRKAPFHNWEPIYVSTNDVPLYDERLSWEGLQDKMSQSYIMCLLDYDFMILDNAFLMHKPGMKKKPRNMTVIDVSIPKRRQARVLFRVNRQIKRKYGSREGCCPSCWF